MTYPYSIYIWQPPLSPHGEGHWSEPAQYFTEEWALYIANLMHQDSHVVIKVVRYGLNLVCFPDERAVELVEKQIARQHEPRELEEPDITFFDEGDFSTLFQGVAVFFPLSAQQECNQRTGW